MDLIFEREMKQCMRIFYTDYWLHLFGCWHSTSQTGV